MKECKFKKGFICLSEFEAEIAEFKDRFPDGFKTRSQFVRNVRDREKNGCKVCHFFKNGFKGEVQAIINPFPLAC